ncbi:hypothetical protein [Nostoc sp. ChiQUE01b]|nr:hypothetical protein [Nostoc sp. ChiQUE01b]
MEAYEKLISVLQNAIERQPPEIAEQLRRIICEVTSQILEEQEEQ